MKKEVKSIKIDKEYHKKLKIHCIENDIKINFVLEKLILEYLNKNNIEKC